MSESDRTEPNRKETDETRTALGMRCDFCGQIVPQVRRVALDAGYDRLQVRHAERYACRDCSEKKERRRLGGDRA